MNFKFLACFCVCLSGSILAQTVNIQPKSFNPKVPVTNALIVMPEVNNDLEVTKALKAESQGYDKMLRFGKELETNVIFSKKAGSFEFPAKHQLKRLRVKSEGALSLNFILSDFFLADGASLHLVDAKSKEFIGAYTSMNNNEARILGTELIHSDEVILELYEPKTVVGQSDFKIQTVVHGFRSLEVLATESLNSSGDCNVDVNCPEGAGWELQRNSVAMMVNGGGFCTGSLVHNTTGTIKPYFLTARHCGLIPTNWVFRFRWEAPTGSTSCATTIPSGNGPESMNVNGGVRRAANGTSDFILVELNNEPDPSWGIFYNGWDRSDNLLVSNGTGIHHPDGDLKKIAIENQALSQTTINFNGFQNRTWKIDDWDVGVTEPGSSGSPLFDQNKRVIGVLSGGSAACSGTNDNGSPDYYGRFGYAWDNGVDSSERLHDWLDPAGTGAVTLDGVDPAVGNVARDASVSGVEGIDGTTCEDNLAVSFTLMNAGEDNLLTCEYRFGSNGNWTSQTFTGNLAQFQTTVITLNVSPEQGVSNFMVEVISVNSLSDQNPGNNLATSDYIKLNDDTDANLLLQLDCYGSETTWEIVSNDDVVVYQGGPYADQNNPTPIDTSFCIEVGCYEFRLYDDYGDGMSGCNQNQGGNGYYVLSNANDAELYAELKEADADFGDSFIRPFCVDFAGISEGKAFAQAVIYPNPGQNNFIIRMPLDSNDASLRVFDVSGKEIHSAKILEGSLEVNASTWSNGVYLIEINDANQKQMHRWVKH